MPFLPPDLSVVIPAYNEEKRINASLETLLSYLNRCNFPYEILVVDDGSKDGTATVVENYRLNHEHVHLLSSPTNRGKGYAVRSGILAARHSFILITDADLSTPIAEIEKLLSAMPEADVAIGSRGTLGADLRLPQSPLRQALGKGFNLILRALGLTGFRDTQCGFKLWKSTAARQVFRNCRINGFAYDVESLVLARLAGLTVREIGVAWENKEGSKVNILVDSPRMLLDTLLLLARIKRNHQKHT